MKSVIATAGLFAIANAYQPLNFHYRRQNDSYPVVPVPAPVPSEVSSEAPQGFTTLTVEVTEVATVTSCKPTITNCPAVSNALPDSDLEVVVVTNVVVLTETVCPITEAESISSAVVKEHETGSLPGSTRTAPAENPALPTVPVPYPDVPLSTAPAVPVTTSAALPVPGEEYVTEVDDVETTATLTLTLGRGESATVVESVITTTFQTTVVKTITACPGGCDGGDATPTDYPVPGGSEGESEDEITTTTTATTTGTKTVTVQPANTAEESSPEASSPVGAEGGVPGSGNGSGECPSAVTVTLPASTVYVTIGGPQPTAATETGNNGNGNGNNGGSSDSGNSPIGGDEDDEDLVDEDEDDCPAEDEEDLDEDEDDCPADEEEDVVVVSQTVTVEPVPYPTGANNGTIPSGVPAPTGGAVSTGAPVPTAAPAYPIYRRFSNAN